MGTASNVLQIGTQVDLKMQAQMEALAAGFSASTKQMQAQIDGLNAKLVQLEAQLTHTAKHSNHQMMEATHGFMAAGNLLGVHLPRAASRFLASISGVGTVMAAAFPILILAEVGKRIFEAAEKATHLKENLAKSAEAAIDAANSIKKFGESLEVSTLKMEDQINTLLRKPTQNGLVIALEEARQKTEELIETISKAIEKQKELLSEIAQGALGKLLGTGDVQKISNDLISGVKESQIKMLELKNKMALDQKEGTKEQVEADRKAYQEELDNFRKLINDKQWSLDQWKKQRVEGLQLPGVNDEGTATPGATQAEAFATATKESHELQNALYALKLTAIDSDEAFDKLGKHTKTSLALAGMEQTKKNIELQVSELDRLNSVKIKGAELDAKIAAQSEKFSIQQKGGVISPEKEAEIEVAAENKIFKAKMAGFQSQLELYNKYPKLFKDKIEQLNGEITNGEKEHQEKLNAITDAAVKKRADMTLASREKDLERNEADLVREEGNLRKSTSNQVKVVEDAAALGLLTKDDEREKLKTLYKKEFDDLTTFINAQITLQTEFRAWLKSHGRGEDDEAYKKSLADEKQLVNNLTQVENEYGAAVEQVNQKTKTQYLTTEQFALKLKTSTKQMWQDFKNQWQLALTEFNHGFISAVNTWIETGKGFGQAMQQTFVKILEGFIDMLVEMALQWIETKIIMLIAGKTYDKAGALGSIATSAAKAGAAGVASWAAAPWPIDAAAPAFGAAMFADALSYGALAAFEKGGFVPKTGLALLHQGETVLPASMSGKGDFGRGVNIEINHSPSVSSLGHDQVRAVLKENVDYMAALLVHKMRRMNFA